MRRRSLAALAAVMLLLLGGCGGGDKVGGGDGEDALPQDPEEYLVELPKNYSYRALAPADEEQALARFGGALERGSAELVIREVVKDDTTRAVVVVARLASPAEAARVEDGLVKSAGGTPRKVLLDDKEAKTVQNPAYDAVYDIAGPVFITVFGANPEEAERVGKKLVL